MATSRRDSPQNIIPGDPYMRLSRHVAALCALVSIALGVPASAEITALQPLVPAPSAESGAFVNETPQMWFVELASPPTARGTSLAKVRNEKAAFRSNAAKAGVKFTERYAYDTLFNGLSVRISPSQVGKLARIDGVKAVYPVQVVRLPVTQTANPELVTALSMTGADIAQSSLGLSGAGVKVAVMDTGIDYNHPDLGGFFAARFPDSTGLGFVCGASKSRAQLQPGPH